VATAYKRGNSWYLNYTQDGRQIRRSLGRITQAEAEAQATAIERQQAGLTAAAGPALAEWAHEYAAWHCTEYPDSYYRVEGILRIHIMPWFGDLPMAAISRRDAEAYKRHRADTGAAPATIAKELRTLQALINKAVEWGVINKNPIKGIKPPRDLNSAPPRWYTADELTAIYQADPTYWPAWKLLANTGLRRTEALALRRDTNITQDAIRVISDAGNRTKSGRWRMIPLTPGARDALQHLGDDLLLPQITPYSLSRAFTRAANRAGLDGNLHCLRHTFCSHLIMRGIPLRTVQVLAGHSTVKVTEKYSHLSPDYLKNVAECLDI